ncbi:MAG: prephenate dehydratase [Bacteroidetes bacterium]|nr:prephenate dehydratase [Bacteroidota bacterium]
MNDCKTIAIQGCLASFHDMAVRKYFSNEEVHLLECVSFEKTCKELCMGNADLAMMAIENSITGSLLPNYALLQKYSMKVVGEEYLHIKQNLMVLPGQRISDIKQVRSHPIALLQCSEYLEAHSHWRAIETFDTAGSAREISDQKRYGVAAIAGTMAARTYGMEILAEEIENLKENSTRFLVLALEEKELGEADKASICFQLQSRPGSLAGVLDIFRQNFINLTKIQSVPIPGKPYQYIFHIDVEWAGNGALSNALQQLKRLTEKLDVFGRYKKGNKVINFDEEQAA